MIISKTPYRISLFGGSTDYESFYREHGSLLIGFAIDKYSYITIRENPQIFEYLSKISYSKIEVVNNNKDILHNGVRGVLEYFDMIKHRLEISCLSDLPAQTGIGSSSSFIVGLINAIKNEEKLTPKSLAQIAIDIERNYLRETGGIQDQIWAAYGGINSISIKKDGDFFVRPLPISSDFIKFFMNHCFLIYTGSKRKSYIIANSHNTGPNDQNKVQILNLAQDGYKAFCQENIDDIGKILKESWEHKKKISDLICTDTVNSIMESLEIQGMIGGKLIGSGGSGFIFGITSNPKQKQTIKELFFNSFIDLDISTLGSHIINE